MQLHKGEFSTFRVKTLQFILYYVITFIIIYLKWTWSVWSYTYWMNSTE